MGAVFSRSECVFLKGRFWWQLSVTGSRERGWWGEGSPREGDGDVECWRRSTPWNLPPPPPSPSPGGETKVVEQLEEVHRRSPAYRLMFTWNAIPFFYCHESSSWYYTVVFEVRTDAQQLLWNNPLCCCGPLSFRCLHLTRSNPVCHSRRSGPPRSPQ